MLTDGRFWVGVILGVVACHFYKARQAAKGAS